MLECMVVVLIATIVLGIGVPSLAEMTGAMRTSNFSNELLASVWLTRNEAIRTNHRVKLCKSANGSDCTTHGTWSQGWLVFVDQNVNGQREHTEPVLRRHEALPQGWSITGNAPVHNYVMYDPGGDSILSNGAFQAGTLTICQQNSGATEAVRIIINKVGRPRTDKATLSSC